MDINSIKPALDLDPVKATQAAVVKPVVQSEPIQKNVSGNVAEQKVPDEKKEEKLSEAVDKLNKTAVIFDRSLRFQVHDKTHRTMVSVIDIASDKVIRQIPSEEVLDLVAKMDDYLGLIFDKKA